MAWTEVILAHSIAPAMRHAADAWGANLIIIGNKGNNNQKRSATMSIIGTGLCLHNLLCSWRTITSSSYLAIFAPDKVTGFADDVNYTPAEDMRQLLESGEFYNFSFLVG
jgi:hypothetical protein